MQIFRHLLLLAVLATSSLTAAGEEPISFNRDVRQILSDRCFKCHGPDAKNQKSEFRLDSAEHAYADLGGYFGIVPGDPENSEMVVRLHTTNADEVMPPADSNLSLTEAEKATLEAWIAQGAKFENHWSFIPVPEQVSVPDAGSEWAKTAIDRFIFAGFAEKGLTPAEEVSKEKWLRRVTFDLTGLPPSLEEIDAFLADESPRGYEAVVDRLLDSDAYAERMTSEWLDVARYSDSYGYQRDHERFVWPWRDWVIEAFRRNMSYDEFVTLQLAGDLLPDATPEQVLATTFNRLHGQVMEGGIVLEEFRVEYVADRTQTFSSAFLGLTMECARCHDHKYDPLPTRDYYSLTAFFGNIDEAGLISYFTEETPTPAMPVANEKQRAELAVAELEIERKQEALKGIVIDSAAAFYAWLANRPAELTWRGLVADVSFDELNDGKMANHALSDAPVTTGAENQLVPGKFGKALRTSGDDPVNVPKVGHFPREQAFSASLWLRVPKIVERANIYSRSGGGDDAAHLGYEFVLLDGKPTASLIHFWPGDAIRIQAKEPLSTGEWHHVAVTYDGSSRADGLSIYLNGERLDTVTVRDHLNGQITEWIGGREDLVIGQRYRDRGFINGEIDAFRLFDRQLTALEARQLHDDKSLALALETPVASLTAAQRQDLSDYFLSTAHGPANEARENLQTARRNYNQILDAIPDISIMRELAEPRPTYVLERGAYDAHGEQVRPDTPTALPLFPDDQPRNRLGLARWLTSPGHPLTGRVTVNRYWQMIFANGLVPTPEDFGRQGASPSHPDLLDWLTRDLIDSGWDLHRLLKMMVLSATYRQSTLANAETRLRDPENVYLARANAQRLSAEMIRDNALATSGLLVRQIGGPPVKPYEVEASFVPVDADKGPGLYRRSLYTWWKRNAPAPMMTTFDASKRDVCALRREQTDSPLQPLVLLNGTQFTEAARVLGSRLSSQHGDDVTAIVAEAFRMLTSRSPDAEEAAILEQLYREQLQDFQDQPELAADLLTVGEAPSDTTTRNPEHAAATILVNSIMNLDEAVLKR